MVRDKERLIVGAGSLAILLVYFSFPTKNYYYDGVDFAHTIETAGGLTTSLVHPNHLIYNLVGYLIYRAVRGVGVDTRALEVLRITNSLLSVLCAFVLFRILRDSIRSFYLGCVLVLLFSFSATWWKFSTDADAYIPSVLFILISFYLILPAQKARPVLVALTFSLGMCFHQLAVIFYPVLAAALYLQRASSTTRGRIWSVFRFSGAAFLLTFTAYYYCFYLVTSTLDFRNFVRWMVSFSPDAGFSFSAWDNLSYTLRGHGRLFFGGRFNLLGGLFNPWIVLLMVALAAVILMLVFQLIHHLQRPDWGRVRARARLLRRQKLALLAILWVSVYLIFLFVWMPQNTFYRMFYLPALILLAGFVLHDDEAARARPRRYRLALFVAALGLSNFLFLVYPYAHVEKFPPLAFALEMKQEWPQATVIYYALPNADNSLFRYFNPQTLWKEADMNDREALENELQVIYSQGATAWLDDSAIEQLSSTPQGAKWLSEHAREESRRKLIDKSYKIQFVRIDPGRVDVSLMLEK